MKLQIAIAILKWQFKVSFSTSKFPISVVKLGRGGGGGGGREGSLEPF